MGVLASASSALAQQPLPNQIPYIESGPAQFSVQYENGKVTVTDLADGTVVIKPHSGNSTVYKHNAQGTTLEPQITFQAQPRGYDVVYTFVNNDSVPRPAGRLVTNVISLGEDVKYYDMRSSCGPWELQSSQFNSVERNYPGIMYSPAVVLAGQRYAVGVTLQYPIMQYKHDVHMMIGTSEVVNGTKGWTTWFGLSNFGTESQAQRIQVESPLQPGEQRTYVVSVRVTKNPQEWIRTLTPYREFFRSTYGGVKYQRRDDPILGISLASSSAIRSDNPAGFNWATTRRPDVYGYGPWVEALKALHGWKRVMLWNNTGMYDAGVSRAFNFPFKFATRWLEVPHMDTALDPDIGFPSLADAGIDLGLWWGNSCMTVAQWNPTSATPMNPNDPEIAARGFAEIDLAAQAGVKYVGLDAFAAWATPRWEQYEWLLMMKERHPEIMFVCEPISCDFLHTIAAQFLRGWSTASPADVHDVEDLYILKNPHYMADFLLPGHETWGAFRYAPHRQVFGIQESQELLNQDIQRYANLGYVPLFFVPLEMDLPDNVVVRDSWKDWIPEELQASVRRNMNFDEGSAVRLGDGQLAIVSGSEAENFDGAAGEPVNGAQAQAAVNGGGSKISSGGGGRSVAFSGGGGGGGGAKKFGGATGKGSSIRGASIGGSRNTQAPVVVSASGEVLSGTLPGEASRDAAVRVVKPHINVSVLRAAFERLALLRARQAKALGNENAKRDAPAVVTGEVNRPAGKD